MKFLNPIIAPSYTSDNQVIKFANPTDTNCKEIMFNPGGADCVDCSESSSSGGGGPVSWNDITGKPSCFPACLAPLDDRYVPLTRTINTNGNIFPLSLDVEFRTAQADTGVFTFDGLAVFSTTLINIGAVSGVIVDNETDPLIPVHTYVNFPGVTHFPIPIIGQATYVFVDATNTITLQNTFPTSQERKEKIWLGKVSHPDGVITLTVDEPDYVTSPLAFSRDMFQAIGPYVNNNIFPYPNGINLTMNITGGYIHGNGINFVGGVANRKDPNRKASGPTSAVVFGPRTQIGGVYAPTSIFDVANYDVGGVITPIPGAGQRASLKYIYAVPTSTTVGYIAQYGQTWYNTITEAISAIGRENQIVFPNLIGNAILIGVLVARKDATDLSRFVSCSSRTLSRHFEKSEVFNLNGYIISRANLKKSNKGCNNLK